ncbi:MULTISPECIES: SDR family oxidoreductase [Streptomyces]|uniref:3-oxoacyl-[acyl-carrier-protein] reductase n=1 Tax=Streptomyces sviceus (strain ATCC 29083 / DSM 924 / JCM 4929 / NBRC 13980 / NCIMB 11184 / NRRL 5439 / UC 5370) TaxID=463191 RepID=B5I4M6_STRX2|nr:MULTISPECIES: SDR family oxidoreductase [Streptomyces]EDY60031.1 3-oxoacyl-[acyl-carrier-protein] reductase [Streptomyces sviceus ATCC 29083]MYT05222.1 SDR family oxidoreductase [Streptomyces sp. SID5470]
MARNVVISGGGTGIGLAAAQVFAAEGDRVLLLGRRAEVLEKAGVPGALTYAADLSDVDQVRGVVGFVGRELGAVDVLIHSAGGTGQLEPPADSTDPLEAVAHNWTVNFRLNLLTAALLTEGLKDRLASPGGRVLFVSSIAAYRGSGSGAYGAAKAGLHPYAYDLARDLGPRGITANVVAPGYIEDTEFFGAAIDPARRERLIGDTSNGRAGTPGDVAATLHWLASPGAGHVTSQIVQVNGGAERGR